MRALLVAAFVTAAAGCSQRPLEIPEGTPPDLGVPFDMIVGADLTLSDLTPPVGSDLTGADLTQGPVATQVSCGNGFTCAVVSGAAKCWGKNDQGQLGNGSNVSSPVPVDVFGLSVGVIGVAAGFDHACAVTTAGAITCWGGNSHGQLGNGTTTDSAFPVGVEGLTGTVATSSGAFFSCALDGNNWRVRCWGADQFGQLGDGSSADSSRAVEVIGLDEDVAKIASGYGHTCALRTNGGLQCWGYNSNGQIGDGTLIDRHRPVAIDNFQASSLGSGGEVSCALGSGAAFCWGANNYGQLGDGNGSSVAMPMAVVGITSGAGAIFEGQDHGCAIVSGGGVRCWGFNNHGELGDGTHSDSGQLTPVDVVGLSSGAVTGAAGNEHTCVVLAGGGVKCWGANDRGQLGNGATGDSAFPVDVVGL
jgi:alpha-tubulin suppressor-like RCC1 family protein